MEYLYAALILHEVDREVTEETVRDVLEAAGAEVDDSRLRALVAALEDVDIDDAIAEAAVGVAPPAVPGTDAAAEGPAEEAPEAAAEDEDEAEDEEDDTAAEGLGQLFG